MGMGAAALAMTPSDTVPPENHMDDLVRASESAEKKSKKERKKDKKSKRDRKEKKEKRKRENVIDSGGESSQDVEPASKKPKATSDFAFDNAKANGDDIKTMDNDLEDTDIGLGTVVKEKITTNDVNSFGMSPKTISLLADKGIKSLFDIQAATFKKLRVEKKDVIGRARTGSGKTLAFVLPIIETIAAERMNLTSKNNKPLVLCLAPTRELAQQVHRDFEWIASGHSMSSTCFTGGTPKGPQYAALRRGVDVLVGTPGRIIDHLDEQSLSLAGVRFVVLDEADEMLSMGFQDAVERILGECTTTEVKQTLLFSATIPRWVKDLARKYMREGETVTVDTVSDDKNRTNKDITHLAIPCPPTERTETIADVVKVYTGAMGKTIIFTDTKAEANDLGTMEKLKKALGGVGLLHGDIAQSTREATLAAYRKGKIRVLVATDVAARGLDIKDVDLVLQTHPPSNYENYIHRSGRTGRAGSTGTCVTFYSQREKYLIGLIEHKAGMKFKRANAPQPGDIVKASVTDTVKLISSVHRDNLALFREVARKVVESYNGQEGATEMALAASLACMAGYTDERFKTRSLLSCFKDCTAMVIRNNREFESPRQAWGLLNRLLGMQLANEAKGMQLCKDHRLAVFDVPDRLVDEFVETAKHSGNESKVEVALELPEMEEESFNLKSAMNNLSERRQYHRGRRDGGRNGGGGWRSGGGGYRSGSGGGWGGGGGRNGGGGRSGNRWSNRSNGGGY